MSKKKIIMTLTALAAVAAGIAMAVGVSSFNQKARNKIIFNAMSPYEEIAEYALKDSGSPDIKDSLVRVKSALEKLKTILPQQVFTELHNKSDAIAASAAKDDMHAAAVLAAESYRTLIDQLDTFWQKNRKEIALLDYAGMSTRIQLMQSEPDWKVIENTANEAGINWSVISGHVEDRRLKDSMSTAISGLKNATVLKDAEMASFAAKMELDLVDLLERHHREED